MPIRIDSLTLCDRIENMNSSELIFEGYRQAFTEIFKKMKTFLIIASAALITYSVVALVLYSISHLLLGFSEHTTWIFIGYYFASGVILTILYSVSRKFLFH